MMKRQTQKDSGLRSFLEQKLASLATKKDLEGLATKKDLDNLVTKKDFEEGLEKLAVMAHKEFTIVHNRLDRIENVILRQHEVKIEDLYKRIKFVEDAFAINHKKVK